MNSRHDATLLFTGTCGCSLPIDSTGGVSAHAQCKQTATAEINEFTGWAIIILQHCMNKIGAHQTMVPCYHGTAHPTEANQLHTQRRMYKYDTHGYLEMFWKPILLLFRHLPSETAFMDYKERRSLQMN